MATPNLKQQIKKQQSSFESILINNSCKYFLHLQLFSEYEEVIKELINYMAKKDLSEVKELQNYIDRVSGLVSNGQSKKKKSKDDFKLLVKAQENSIALIIWEEICKDINREQLYSFFSGYFSIGDITLSSQGLRSDMDDAVYGQNILKQYIRDMISIYDKGKNDEIRKDINKEYGLLTSKDNYNDLSGFIHSIVNIVLYCKLKEIYTNETDCYNKNLFDEIIRDFTTKINPDKQTGAVNNVQFSNMITKRKEMKKGAKYTREQTTIIHNELLRRANENEARDDDKKRFIKDLDIELSDERVCPNINEHAYRKLMGIIANNAFLNIKRKPGTDPGVNLVTHIDSIFTELSQQKEDTKKISKNDFEEEFYNKYNLNNVPNITQLINYCLDIIKTSKFSKNIVSFLKVYEKYGLNLLEIKKFFTELKEMYNIKSQNYPVSAALKPGSSDDEYKKYMKNVRNNFIRKQNEKLTSYIEEKGDIFAQLTDSVIVIDLNKWEDIEKRIKSKINVINWILLYQSRLDRYIHGYNMDDGYKKLVDKVEKILNGNTQSAKIFNQYKDNIQLKVENIYSRGIYETIGWTQFSPEGGLDILTENYYLYKTFAVANEALITKLTTKEDIEEKNQDDGNNNDEVNNIGKKRSNYRNFYDHATEEHIKKMIIESIPKDQAHDFADSAILTGEQVGDALGLGLSMGVGRVQDGNILPQLDDYMKEGLDFSTDVTNRTEDNVDNVIKNLYEGYHGTTTSVSTHGKEIAHVGEQMLYEKSQNRFFMNVRAIQGKELETELNTRENMIWSPEPLYQVTVLPNWNSTKRIGSTLPSIGNPGYHKFLNFLEPYFDSSNENGEIHQWFWERKSLDKPDIFQSTSYKNYGNRIYNIWKNMKNESQQKKWIKTNEKLLLEYFSNKKTRVDRKLRFLQMDANFRPSAYNLVYNQKREILLGHANKGDDILTILSTAGKSDQSSAKVGDFFETSEYFSNPIINPGTGHTAYKNITYMESAQNTNKTVIPLTRWTDEKELLKERIRCVLLYCKKMYKEHGEEQYKKNISYENSSGFQTVINNLSVPLTAQITATDIKNVIKDELIKELKMEDHFIYEEIERRGVGGSSDVPGMHGMPAMDGHFPVKWKKKNIINEVNLIESIGEKVSFLVEQIPTKNKNVDGIYHLNDMYKEYLNDMAGELGLYKVCKNMDNWADQKKLKTVTTEYEKLKDGDTKKGVINYVYNNVLDGVATIKFCDIIVNDKEIYEHIPSDLIRNGELEKGKTVDFYPGYNNIRNKYRQECMFRSNASWKIKFIKEKYRIMKIKKMLAKEDEDVWNIETYNFLEKELNRLNEDSTDNTIGYNYNFKKSYKLNDMNVEGKNFVLNSMSEKIYKRILEKKKELDKDLSEMETKTVKYYPFYIEKENEKPKEKAKMKTLLGANYVRSGEVKKILEGSGTYGAFVSLHGSGPIDKYLKTVEKDEYLSGLIAFNLSFKEAKNDDAIETIKLMEDELTTCVENIINNRQETEHLSRTTHDTITQNPYNWFCKADKMIEMSKYRGLFLNNSGYQHSNEVVITPLDKIFFQIALSDFYTDTDDNGELIIKTSVLPNINKGNTSWMQHNILTPLADDNKKMDEAFQKVEQRLSLLYKSYTESVAENPKSRLVTGTYRRVGNDMTDTPSVTECMFHYRIRAPITLFLLMKLCTKNDIILGDHIGKIKLRNSKNILEKMANNSWLLKIYEDRHQGVKTNAKDKNKVAREKAIKEYKELTDETKKILKWKDIIDKDNKKTKQWKDLDKALKTKTKEARLKELDKKIAKKDLEFSIEHYIKCCIMGKVSRTEGLAELPYLEECLPQIIRQITELGRKIEVKGKIENLNMIDIGKIKELKDFHELFSKNYTNESVATRDMLQSALSYTSDDIYQKLYRFLGYGYDKDENIINVNDILFYLCCPLYQKSFSDFMQWEQGDFLQNMYSPNKYGIQNVTLTGTYDTYAAFAGACSICSPTLFERSIPGTGFKTKTQLGKTPTVLFSCALERNTKYPMWLYITHHKVFKKSDGKETMLLGSVPLSDPKYSQDDYYRKKKIEVLSGKYGGVTEKISYTGEGVIYKTETGKYYYNLSCVSIDVLNKIIEIIIELVNNEEIDNDDFLITGPNNEITNPDMFNDENVQDIKFIDNFINIRFTAKDGLGHLNTQIYKWEMHTPEGDKIVGVSNTFVEKYFSDIDEVARESSEDIIIEDNFGIILEKVAFWKREYKNILKFYEICQKNWKNFEKILSAYENTVGGTDSEGKPNLTRKDIKKFLNKDKLQANPKDKKNSKIQYILNWLRAPTDVTLPLKVVNTEEVLSNMTPSSENTKNYDEVHFWFEGDAWNGLGLTMNTWRRTMRENSVFFRYFPFCKPMSEYENFETFLEQVDEAMKGRIIRGVQYGGAGPAEQWVKGKKYINGNNVFTIENEVKKYYRYESGVLQEPQQSDLQYSPGQSELWIEISEEEGEDDDASTDVGSMSDSSSDDERGIEDEQGQEKLRDDISDAFDKILKLEKQKEQLNDKITNSEGAEVDEIIKKMNEIKKSIELRPPRDDLSIEEVVENEKVEWNEIETLDRSGMDIEEDGSTDEGEDLLGIISESLKNVQIEEATASVIDSVVDNVVMNVAADKILDQVSEQVLDEAIEKAIKEDLINEHLKERYELLRKIYFEKKEKIDMAMQYNIGSDEHQEWVYMWEEAYQKYERDRKNIRQIEEDGKPKFVLMTDAEYNQWAEDNGKTVSEEELKEEMKQINTLFELLGAGGKGEKRVLTPPTAARKRRRRERTSSMSDNDIIQTIKNTLKLIDDVSEDSQDEQLARMREEDNWKELFLEQERERRMQEPNPLGSSREQGGGGRKKRKNRTLKKKRNKFLVYLENLYG